MKWELRGLYLAPGGDISHSDVKGISILRRRPPHTSDVARLDCLPWSGPVQLAAGSLTHLSYGAVAPGAACLRRVSVPHPHTFKSLTPYFTTARSFPLITLLKKTLAGLAAKCPAELQQPWPVPRSRPCYRQVFSHTAATPGTSPFTLAAQRCY